APTQALLRGAAPADLRPGGELGIRVLTEHVRPARRPDLRPQVPLDTARVSTRLSDGRNALGLPHRRGAGCVAGAAQPARGGTCSSQLGGVSMNSMLRPLRVRGFAGPLAARDTTARPAAPPAAAPPAASTATVEAVLARTVVDRVPQDTGTAFSDSVGTVVLWMRVTDGSGQTLHHVWFHGGEQVGDVPLTIGGTPGRAGSRQAIPAEGERAGRGR